MADIHRSYDETLVAALESERNRAQLCFDLAQAIFVSLDLHGRIVLVNPKACEVLGYREEEMLGRDWFELAIPPAQREAQRQVFARVMEKKVGLVETYENPIVIRGGEQRVIAWRNAYLEDANGAVSGILSSGVDVTEPLQAQEAAGRLESRVLQAQKLESLGILAGGIAHDFNNLLVGMLGNADLALADLAPGSPIRENIAQIKAAATRASELCRQLLAYSGKGRFVIEPVDLSEIVREMLHLIEVSISKKAVLKLELSTNLSAVEADATQLRQIVMNLITNASEALGEGSGIIGLTTGEVDCDENDLTRTSFEGGLAPGRCVFLEVSDTGAGMDSETLKRIFDPFYTTKFTGRGLGLAAVMGIVRGHRGAIDVQSEPGKGTIFKVLLPASSESAQPRIQASATAASWHGHGVALLVDDEVMIREVGRMMLERLGFEVVVASDGIEALEVYVTLTGRISVVLLDMTMPRLGGVETFEELRRIDPDIRVILSSGFNEQDATSRFAGSGLAGFIQKPYELDQLRDALRMAMEG